MTWKGMAAFILAIVVVRGIYSLLPGEVRPLERDEFSDLGIELAPVSRNSMAPQSQIPSSSAKSATAGPSEISWKDQLESLRRRRFAERAEATRAITEFANALMLDSRMGYETKMALRTELERFETGVLAKLPEPRIVGFTKVPIKERDPESGYILSPELK